MTRYIIIAVFLLASNCQTTEQPQNQAKLLIENKRSSVQATDQYPGKKSKASKRIFLAKVYIEIEKLR